MFSWLPPLRCKLYNSVSGVNFFNMSVYFPEMLLLTVKIFCERPIIASISIKPISVAPMAVKVIITLFFSIIISDPINSVIAETSVPILILSD